MLCTISHTKVQKKPTKGLYNPWQQICNVPDPLTGEEDATNTKNSGKQPHEHEQAYNAEIKSLNIIHTMMYNP